jgi:hypothetical protein
VTPCILDCIIKYFYELRIRVGNIKKMKMAYAQPNNPDEADATKTMATLETLIRTHVFSKRLEDSFLSTCTLAKIRYNLANGHFVLDEFLGCIALSIAWTFRMKATVCFSARGVCRAVTHCGVPIGKKSAYAKELWCITCCSERRQVLKRRD